MKYPYDKGFRKVAFNMPFCGWMCKMTHKPLKRMVDRMNPAKGVTLRNCTIPGYQGESIDVKEITPDSQFIMMDENDEFYRISKETVDVDYKKYNIKKP